MVDKAQLRAQFAADWKVHYDLPILRERGYSRQQCSSCHVHFWSQAPRTQCGDSACIGYQFIGNPASSKKLTYAETWKEIETGWPEDAKLWRGRDPHWSPMGGESLTVLRERIANCVHALASQHVGEQIALVAHGGVMDALYRLATQQAIEAPRTWHLGNAAINRLLWTPQGLSLVGWGDVSHFDDATGAPRDETTT